ncbi:LysR family transcriptional regulator [Caballeronia arationis]|jgi:DNA-binding transcriptional LysR family regulator|uniref:Transcriptional regulator, LysR family n=1 Tax=Caballeronia arationis TaxID=1777142 RepID=A0A7Z7IC33_9BURK|nr:LysR family transcriptional regulator [Caballeronia arationis]SAK87626.1 LysR family transcriptional regulator [Caballeronia arationis]SOE81826.1 transcriptional regulator, LysR family [Caballeronia arationis]
MTPDQLITFATVAEFGNISRAATALHLSQPAVSGQLRQLQDEFGEPLYQRDGRGVRLTAAGEQLAEYAARIRETYRQAYAFRDALRGLERGTLRIGASTTPASYLLPYLIAAFHGEFPDIAITTIDGNTSDIVAALPGLDIAMIEGPVGVDLPPGTSVTPWREDEIVAILPASHALAPDRGEASLDAISAHPLVLRESGSGVRQIVERAFASAGAPMRIALEIAGVEGVKEAVRAGMGIGFVSAMSIRHEDDALRRLRIAPEPLTRRFSILLPHSAAPSRVAARFLELCLADPNPA